jgi:YVTN family beta-propeller protein
MGRWIPLLFAMLVGCSASRQSNAPPLVTGRAISPRPRSQQDVGSFPINLVTSPDGRYSLISDIGYREALWSVRTSDGKAVSRLDFSNGRPGAAADDAAATGEAAQAVTPRSNGLYYGLAVSSDNVIYAAQGAHDSIAVLSLGNDGAIKPGEAISARRGDFPAGMALDDRGRMYVANNGANLNQNNPYKLSGSVAIYDRAAKVELGRYVFSASYGGTSNFPLGIAALSDGSKAYVAAERDDCVYVLDTRDPSHPGLGATISTGAHPVSVLLSRDQSRAYVANSLGDTISVIDTHSDRVIGTITLRPRLVRDLPGVTPTGLALSPDQKTLYAALSDMNAVAVIDTAAMTLKGYVPAGWYPTSLAVSSDGRRLLVANAKGTKGRLPNAKLDLHGAERPGYVLTLLVGNVIRIKIPTGDDLEEATAQVLKNDRLDALPPAAANPLAAIGLSAGKIKHVIYIIKENRTYDQVLGDLPQGNGDSSQTLFGLGVTPNQHAMAQRFVLLDNLYTCGDVSGDGWVWGTQGMADAYIQRNVPYSYSGRGRKFDSEGQNSGYITGGFPAKDENGKPLAKDPAFKNGAAPIPDVGNTGRTIWDAAREAGIPIRNYGFFLSFNDHTSGVTGVPDNYPAAAGLQPPGHDLAGVSDIDFRRFDLDYPDSDAPAIYFKQTGDPKYLFAKAHYGRSKSPSRFAEWNREFQMMLARDATGADVPALMTVRLMMDHTSGAKSGKHSPSSCVADNDFAMGQLVGAVSHSPIWSSTAIFVIEDDAQNGNDHVDCHRTTGYIISPWIKAGSVDHRFYNTDSFLKTIELILGLKPLSQYDAVADSVMDWDSSPDNSAPFDAVIPSKELFSQINPAAKELSVDDPRRQMAMRSDAMDLYHPDAAPADELNRIVWQTVKGPTSLMPAPRGIASDDDDDHDRDR